MLRNWDMKNVSDGKLYNKDDIVKVGCGGCNGCADCCHAMDNSIVLDPYDIYRMTSDFGCTMNDLLDKGVELNVVDGLILPNLKMTGNNNGCYYLDEEGRCSIHKSRPGICRMFPIGRIYDKGSFNYFIQIHECKYPNKSEVRISDWLDTNNLKKYEKYIVAWHEFLGRWRGIVAKCEDEQEMKQYMMYLLMQFYNKSYESDIDFYQQFYDRLNEAVKFE